MESKNQQVKLLKEIQQLHQNLHGKLQPVTLRGKVYYQASFMVKSNEGLITQIANLLEVCVFALDGNGMLLSPSNQNITKEESVSRVLEMVLDLLPDAQMFCLDKITEILSSQELKKE
ncbi:hypothetical protein MWU65_17255 [Cellulophaga sp. F20128]|uniref:hypothetical protein n=1 Tax=Cellulophaga sp. F20128 TaxID=2926413 RepID=UPI001FF2D2B3|nr:hypothetical protein [Cellulophaga sp. F20128]MCK0158938.1 hypothetical protein [Cellulophaga sp. F20128]